MPDEGKSGVCVGPPFLAWATARMGLSFPEKGKALGGER